MLEKNLVMGGEGNGGVIYRRINNCRDSLIATFLVLEYIARTGKKLSEIKGEYPILYPVKERIPVQAEIPFDAIREKIAGFLKRNNISVQDVNREDGLRVDYTGGWIQVRASNTEPIIRIMGESRNPDLNLEMVEVLKDVIG
jgi:phosphomannomutase